MNLTITGALVRDLYDRVRTTRRPDETAIALTADGWDTHVWTTPTAPWPIAITGMDIHALLDDEEPASGADLDDDLVESLAAPDPVDGDTTYTVPAEDGDYARSPAADATPQILTHRFLNLDADTVEALPWQEARWFDLAQATRLLTTFGDRDAYGRDFELWVTAGGHYVARRSSSHVAEPGDSWVAMTADQAAVWLFDADEDHIDPMRYGVHGLLRLDAPPLLVGARAFRAAADAVTAPTVPITTPDDNETVRHPGQVADEALQAQETAVALIGLARNVVAPALRRTRAYAVRVLVEAHGGQEGAAAVMGVSQPTVAGIVG